MNAFTQFVDAYPLQVAGIFVAIALVAFTAIAMFLVRHNREVEMRHKIDIVNIVDRMIAICDRKRSELTNDEAIGLVYHIHSKVPGQYAIWARMSVREKTTIITVECASGVESALLDFAKDVLAALRDQDGVTAGIRFHCPQPEEEMSSRHAPAHRNPSAA